MPFAIELIKFTREDHPGTGMARRFSSEVMVHEAGSSRRVVISMNRPLRIGPWTLYQQSYSQSADGTVVSVLAVVRDRWQLSPYISSAVMLLGLLLHLVLRIRRVGLA
jgi:cytochrome c biogenesis protein ResB